MSLPRPRSFPRPAARRCAIVVALAAAALRSSAAYAQPVVPPTAGDFEQAAAELRVGHAEEARRIFQRLYALQPTPRTAYGLGASLFQLQRYLEALPLLERYIAEPRDASVTPEVLSQVRGMVDTARRSLAHVTLQGEPAGAAVTVDDRPAVVERGEVTLDPGRHLLTVRAEGHVQEQRALDLPPGEHLTLSLRLGRLPRLVVDEPPAGATVLLDGRALPAGPVDLTAEAGPHLVVVRSAGCAAVERRVELRENDVYRLAAEPACARASNRWILPVAIAGGVLLGVGAVVAGVLLTRGDAAPMRGTWATAQEGH